VCGKVYVQAHAHGVHVKHIEVLPPKTARKRFQKRKQYLARATSSAVYHLQYASNAPQARYARGTFTRTLTLHDPKAEAKKNGA